eukprot:722654-Pelagomonas_calceolata.AAC.1
MEQPFLQQASVQDVSDFLLQHNNKLFSFVSELMDIMLTGEDQSQSDQPNSLAKDAVNEEGAELLQTQATWNAIVDISYIHDPLLSPHLSSSATAIAECNTPTP